MFLFRILSQFSRWLFLYKLQVFGQAFSSQATFSIKSSILSFIKSYLRLIISFIFPYLRKNLESRLFIKFFIPFESIFVGLNQGWNFFSVKSRILKKSFTLKKTLH